MTYPDRLIERARLFNNARVQYTTIKYLFGTIPLKIRITCEDGKNYRMFMEAEYPPIRKEGRLAFYRFETYIRMDKDDSTGHNTFEGFREALEDGERYILGQMNDDLADVVESLSSALEQIARHIADVESRPAPMLLMFPVPTEEE